MNRYRFLGFIAYYLTSLLHKTLSVTVECHPDFDTQKQYLGAFWHGKQLMPVLKMSHYLKKGAVLVSSSRDGDILATWLSQLGYTVIRGSSRHNNIRALAQMIRALKEGYSLGFGVDGPIGPIYKVKPGMTHMAQKCGVEIIPMGSAFSRKWIVTKAWDRYEIPKPFAKVAFYIGKPVFVDKEAELEHYNLLLEERIQEAEAHAASLLFLKD